MPVFAQTGIMKGRITSKDGFSLPSANIHIPSLQIGTAADLDGAFLLARVPVGTHEIVISHLGYVKVTRTVTVREGETTVLNVELEPGVVEGEEVVVVGEYIEGQARSFSRQRENINITNIVSSDQIGRFPDANIGDALKRIPSITVNYDQGEARFVNIRGTAPELNSIMVNGERIPSAEAERRAVQVDLVPADMIAAIEVHKAVLPDMDADAIGGSVNLVTRAVPSGTRLTATLGSGYNALTGMPIWNGNFVLGQRFMDDKLGVIVSGSLNDHRLGSDNAEGEWAQNDSTGNVYVKEWDVRKYDIRRLRQSFSAALDYTLGENSALFIKAMYNHRNDWENRYRLRYILNEPNAQGISNRTEIRRQTKGGADDGRTRSTRLEDQRTQNFSLAGQHLVSGFIKTDWRVSYAKASEERPNERYLQYRRRISGSPGLQVRVDLSNPRTPYFTPVNSTEVEYQTFTFHQLSEEFQYTEERDFGARLNFEIPLSPDVDYGNSVKAGFSYKQKEKNRDNRFHEYTPKTATMANLGLVEASDYSDANYLAGDYRIGYFPTRVFLGRLNLRDPALFTGSAVPEETAGNFDATETITAGYAMLKQSLGTNLQMIAGLRIEKTAVENTGLEYDNDSGTLKPIPGKGEYLNALPGLHLRYKIDEFTVVRAAWTNTIARPRYFDLVGYRQVFQSDDELHLGNPSLKPTTSMNIDFMAEHYFANIGILSGGVFYKGIDNFIYVSRNRNYLDPASGATFGSMFQPRNGRKATLYGFEAAIQRKLDFLPSFLSNISLYTNYTYTFSKTDRPDDPSLGTIKLPGTAEHVLNGSLTYSAPGVTVGLALNYSSPYLDPDELDLTPQLERYYDSVTRLDFNASFVILPQVRLFIEGSNLLNQPLRYYAGVKERTYQAEFYDVRYIAGMKFDL
jgi:TonB-dependent receptor